MYPNKKGRKAPHHTPKPSSKESGAPTGAAKSQRQSSKSPNSKPLAKRAQSAVYRAYQKHGNKVPAQNPIFTEEMFGLLQEQDPHTGDPLCLFRYFSTRTNAEWFVYGAERLGKNARHMITGESGEGHIHFWAFACLGDPQCAEAGIVPLDKEDGMGLRDLRSSFPGLAAVELDRYYEPERLSEIRRQFQERSMKRGPS